jgi:hypothetical protein
VRMAGAARCLPSTFLPLRVSEFVCNDGHTLHSAASAE